MKKMVTSGLLLILLVSVVLPAYISVQAGATINIASKGKPPWAGGPGGPEEGEGAATGNVSDPPGPENRWALIIGIADYLGTENDLEYTDDDALDLNETLVEKYGYWVNHTKVLIDGAATKSDILNAIAWLRNNEKEGDEVVFYYSGHGTRGVKWDSDKEAIDEGIVPADFDGTGSSVIWDGDLAINFSDFETTRFFIGFDTCYAGGFDDLAGDGRVICMSSKESQSSYESNIWQNGEFTYYFVDQAMLNQVDLNNDGVADADANEDGDITVEEAFDYAKANCQYDNPVINDQFPNDMLL